MYNCLGNSIATYGNGRGTVGQPFIEMEENCWATAYGNGEELFGQPLMETKGDCLGNRFIQPKQVTQHSMQPL
jgi:hypothetical protein